MFCREHAKRSRILAIRSLGPCDRVWKLSHLSDVTRSLSLSLSTLTTTQSSRIDQDSRLQTQLYIIGSLPSRVTVGATRDPPRTPPDPSPGHVTQSGRPRDTSRDAHMTWLNTLVALSRNSAAVTEYCVQQNQWARAAPRTWPTWLVMTWYDYICVIWFSALSLPLSLCRSMCCTVWYML